MDNVGGFILFVVFGLLCILSYEIPIYISRLVGREYELNQAWTVAMNDSKQSATLFFIAYVAVGFFTWALPVFLVVKFWRKILFVLISPLYPAGYLLSTVADRLNSARVERAHLLALYRAEFRDQFRSFQQFRKYVDRLDADGGAPPVGFSADTDPYNDALLLLGLAGDCTKANADKRFRDLMMRVHPDQAGPNDIARRVTEARKVIAARRGW